MSKGLESLERIKSRYNDRVCIDILEDFDLVEKDLKDKEKFEELVNMDLDLFMKAVDIKGLIEDYQKFKQALEIIKKKSVDIKYLRYRAEFNVEKYNDNYIETLTKEECDLLKEVLKK